MKQNQKGFTLIELIVVVAIMGVIGAILIPQFSTMNLRSRLSTDVSSLKIAQAQVEYYYTEKGKWPGTGSDGKTAATVETVLSDIIKEGYLDARYVSKDAGKTKFNLMLQTKGDGISTAYDASEHKFYFSLDEKNYNTFNKEEDKEMGWVTTDGKKPGSTK